MRAILTYHSIDDSGSPISITAAAFRRHAAWLAHHGPRCVTVDELLRLPAEQSAVAITFDDAFVNFADVAWPILRDHGLTATLYVPTDHVGRTNAWGGAAAGGIPALPICDWETLGRLAENGVVLGSHTRTHPVLTRLSAAALHDELHGSAEGIRRTLGIAASGLAYPFGAFDEMTMRAAAAIYRHACTTDMRTVGAHDRAHGLPRLDAYYFRNAGAIEAWGTMRWRLYVRARAGARRCRQMLVSASHR